MRILDIRAYPTSFPIPKDHGVTLGIGRLLKRDAVVVKVTAEDGVVGWGESHHGRSPSTIAHIVNTTLRDLTLGMEATDVVGVWDKIYRMQLRTHGLGAAVSMAMSGIDMALWDIRGKLTGWPLHRLLGGGPRPVRAYAGGIALGFQEPAALVEEASAYVAAGYRAVKLRVGDTPRRDVARVTAVRKALGDDVVIMVDANTSYTADDVRAVMPAFEEAAIAWLEEPFPAHDYRSYQEARSLGRIPFAAGENHFTRFEFHRLVEDRAVAIIQPDISKAGGVTETARIAALASAWKLPIHPHSSMTGLNMAATIHFLASIDNAGYFEGDVSRGNLFRDELTSTPFAIAEDGCVRPLEGPGLGLAVDEDFLAAHPFMDGPSYAAS
jgi:L-alanine-DL-glutamate epimerase-like enolase superfamily enzyme